VTSFRDRRKWHFGKKKSRSLVFAVRPIGRSSAWQSATSVCRRNFLLLLAEYALDPAVHLFSLLTRKLDCFAGFYEPANLLQTQLLRFLHADVQSSACLILQAHLVLETSPPFRLILHWKRLKLPNLLHEWYNPRDSGPIGDSGWFLIMEPIRRLANQVKNGNVGVYTPMLPAGLSGILTYARIGARRSSVEPPNFNTEDLMP
jgi:hypothetical protein